MWHSNNRQPAAHSHVRKSKYSLRLFSFFRPLVYHCFSSTRYSPCRASVFCLCDKQQTVPDALLLLGWRSPESLGMVGGPGWPGQRWRRKLQHPHFTLWHCPKWKTLHLPCQASPSGSRQNLQAHTGSLHIATLFKKLICYFDLLITSYISTYRGPYIADTAEGCVCI